MFLQLHILLIPHLNVGNLPMRNIKIHIILSLEKLCLFYLFLDFSHRFFTNSSGSCHKRVKTLRYQDRDFRFMDLEIIVPLESI